MSRIDLVIFDVAGTVLQDDNSVLSAFHSSLDDFGYDPDPEIIKSVMGWSKPKAISHILEYIKPDKVDPEEVDEIYNRFVNRMMDHYRNGPNVSSIDGAEETMLKLRSRGVMVALDTGFSRPILDTIICRLRWEAVVDATVTSDEVLCGRPAPDMILSLSKKLIIHDMKNIAKVGDTPSDVESGRNAGCGLVVGVTSGTGSVISLARHNPDYILPSIKLIPDIVRCLNSL